MIGSTQGGMNAILHAALGGKPQQVVPIFTVCCRLANINSYRSSLHLPLKDAGIDHI